MLILRRKAGERLVLSGAITVSILAVEGERVKLGIDAPPDVTIVREELTQHEQTQHRRSLDGWNEQNIPAEH